MVDFHTHILPEMDDGSRTAAQSIQMLERLSQQGVDTVALTPHFYGMQESPGHFLLRREESLEKLAGALSDGLPALRVGAEVLYFRGISRMKELYDLRLSGTKVLLLEMPFEPWDSYAVQEVRDLSCDPGLVVLLAHIDRYLAWQNDRVWDTLLGSGVKMQANAAFFTGFLQRKKACRMLSRGMIHVLGTDCHNMDTRSPNMDQAIDGIIRQMGDHAAGYLQHCSREFLKEWSF